MVRIAFIFNRRKFSGWLTRLWTGCYCYHVAFVDERDGVMYDMNLLRRKRAWPHYPPTNVVLVDTPVAMSREFLEGKLLSDENRYGVLDYCYFILRPALHLFGRLARDLPGTICSEMIYEDLRECGWTYEFPEVPSPCDLYRILKGN